MPGEKSLVDKLGDRMNLPERVESDEILRWDGKMLYVEETRFRGRAKAGEDKRDVTAEVAASFVKLLGKR